MLRPPPESDTPPKFKRRRVLLALDLAIGLDRRAGIMEYAREAGWILDSRLMAFLMQQQHVAYLRSTPFDGVISLVSPANAELHRVLKPLKVPIVDLWNDFPKWNVPRVHLDHRAAGTMAADYLCSLGLKSLLFYSHSVDRRVANIRFNAFRERAIQLGAEVRELCWEPNNSTNKLGRIVWLGEELKKMPLPLGVLAVNDPVASEIIDAADHANLSIPGHVAVLGINNDPILTELGPVTLSSIEVALAKVGYEAAALLDRLMSGEKPPREPVLVAPAGVITRRSTEVLAIKDPEIIRAARFIRDHFREAISVADVASQTLLSQRRLQDKFYMAVGHSMSEEITRQRLEFCKHLLMNTNHKIASIATMAGFHDYRRMIKVFRRVLKTTPQVFRQTYQPTHLRQG